MLFVWSYFVVLVLGLGVWIFFREFRKRNFRRLSKTSGLVVQLKEAARSNNTGTTTQVSSQLLETGSDGIRMLLHLWETTESTLEKQAAGITIEHIVILAKGKALVPELISFLEKHLLEALSFSDVILAIRIARRLTAHDKEMAPLLERLQRDVNRDISREAENALHALRGTRSSSSPAVEAET